MRGGVGGVGGAITIDSDPEEKYGEALIRSLEPAGEAQARVVVGSAGRG